MYLDIYGARNTIEALENYAHLAGDWINQVKKSGSINSCYPFKAAPTIEMADLLESRVKQIKNNLIPNIEKISIVKSNV